MGEAVADAFFSEQAGNEGEIGFAVLQAVGADGVGFAKLGLVLEAFVESGVAGAVFVEDGFDDLRDCFVLEDPAVAAVGERGEGRFNRKNVFGKAAVGAGLFGTSNNTGEQALSAFGEKDGDFDGLA